MATKIWGLAVGAAVLALPVASLAQFNESESNNTFGTGNFFDRSLFAATGAIAIDGSISPRDVDYFRFDLVAGDYLSLFVATGNPGADDTVLGIFMPDGSLFDYNDDAFGLNSAWAGVITETGRWGVAVTGYSDFEFTGDHSQEFTYKLTVGLNPVVPEPASIAALGIGVIALLARRRK